MKAGNGVKEFLNSEILQFPYKSELSLEGIIQSWERKAKSKDPFTRTKAEFILKLLEENPTLRKSELSPKDIKGKEHIFQHLFSDSFSIDMDKSQAFAVSAPFAKDFIYSSKRFKELYSNAILCQQTINTYKSNNPKLMNAFALILKEVYKAHINILDIPFIIPVLDPSSGLRKYHKIQLSCTDFAKVIALNTCKDFENKCFSNLTHRYDNIAKWLEYLPPKDYIFRGVSLISLVDITEQEALNQIQNILLKNTILTKQIFNSIDMFASDFLEVAKTQVGVIAFDKNLNILQAEKNFGLSILFENGVNLERKDIINISDEFKAGKKLIFIDNEVSDENYNQYHKQLLKNGIGNLVLAPMYKEGRLIGLFEVKLPENHSFSAFYVHKLYRLIPLFELALDRSVENVNNKIQNIIKDHCTAIHPSVEWRFFSSASKLYKSKLQGHAIDQMEDIVFEDVMPLYGLSDIRNSSIHRTNTIKQDLIDQLSLAGSTIVKLNKSVEALAFQNLLYKIDERLNNLKKGSAASENEENYGFLEREVNFLLVKLRQDSRYSATVIDSYLDALDPNVGILYRKRRDFDESVSRVNLEISRHLDRQQQKLQVIYPHYFDKYQTDGVDYNIYIGQSITPEIPYHPFYLRNLRLWQLSSMCQIAALTYNLKKELAIPLETAQLILIQNLPLNIKFRYEEKRFDIDSAYNARYEIVKKRIDKAVIAQTGERLTQPGKVAIVYSNQSLIKEYIEYIEFLQNQKVLKPDIEYLELEELQGTEDLKALRVSVNQDSKSLSDEVFTEKILEKIQI